MKTMLKRMTKVTSLLVCAASIVSMVPAMAADVKKYDAQEGTVYNAKAKGVGIYIDGAVNGKDEDVYFMALDGKYTVLDGIDDGSMVDDLFLNQYLAMDDGDTVVDIKNNYKVIDENTKQDLLDDAATNLRKEIKADNDGRFTDAAAEEIKNTENVKFQAAGSGLNPYTYALDKVVVAGKTSDKVYGDYTGKYVDADYNLGNVKITTTPGGSTTVNFKNTEDTYEAKDGSTTYEYRAFITDGGYITDIGDYIYRWANLSIYKKTKGAVDSTYVNVTGDVGFGSKGYDSFVTGSTVPVLQKFSKTAATDDIDGIKYSKDAAIYFLTDEDGNDETLHTSDKVILGKSKSESALKVGATSDSKDGIKITGNAQGFCSAYLDVSANDGKGKIYAQNLQLKSKEGFNYVDLGDTDSTDSDIASISNTGGLIYVLNGGYVKAWDTAKEDFEKVYKVDGSMENMSIGSKDFMILWSEDDEVYTIINNKKDATTTTGTTAATGTAVTTGTTATTSAAAGWVKATDGAWSYNKDGGTKATGWLQDGATWYYLSSTGVMQTGWINDNGTWYYLNASGAMLANTTVDGYILGASGAWVK